MTIMNYIGIGAAILLVIMEVAMYIIVRMTNQHKWTYLAWDFFTVVDLIILILSLIAIIETGKASVQTALDLFFIGMYFPLAIGIINDD